VNVIQPWVVGETYLNTVENIEMIELCCTHSSN